MFNSIKTQISFLILAITGILILSVIFFNRQVATETMLKLYDDEAKDKLHLVYLHVENQYKSVEFFRDKYLNSSKQELENVVTIAIDLIEHYYGMYQKGDLTQKEAQKMLFDDLRTLRFKNDVGYVWINDTSSPLPHILMHPVFPETENKILDDPKYYTANGTNTHILKAFVDVCRKNNEGFVEYIWPKPSEDSLFFEYKKLSYVRIFKPWGWIVGSGIYIDEIEKNVKQRQEAVLDELRLAFNNISENEAGYMFIFSGDNEILVHPQLRYLESVESVSDFETTSKLFQDLKQASLNPDVPLIYFWPKADENDSSFYKKYSYVKYFELLDWYICSSFYADEVESTVRTFNNRLIIIFGVIFLFSLLIGIIISNRLSKPIRKLAEIVSTIVEKGIPETGISVKGSKEVKNLAAAFNHMMHFLNIKKKEIFDYREHLEELVKERTLELEETMEYLEIAKKEADKANSAKSEFLANMSHEIRTPLNSIFGFGEILQDKIENPEHLKYVQYVISGGNVLLELIDNVLDLSKIEAERLEMNFEAFNLPTVLDTVCVLFENRIKKQGLNFIVEISDDLPPKIVLDKVRLKQILINLIGNAIKFTPKGFIKLTADVEYTDKENRKCKIIIAVKDSGIGIERKNLEVIFGAFNQVKNYEEEQRGTGLGLTISQKLATLMGGEISVSSVENIGSTFSLVFDDVVFDDTEEIVEEEDKKSSVSYDFKQAKVLLIDDILENREIFKLFLKNVNVQLLVAEGGEEGLEIFNKELPDIILLDMKMPKMSGLDFMKIIREKHPKEKLPIIVVSAASLKEEIQKAEVYCNSYLVKPVLKKLLLAEMAKYLA